MQFDNRAYKCTWKQGKDLVTKNVTFDFFSTYNGYEEEQIDEVDALQPNQSANFSDFTTDHFVRRVK